MKTILSRLAITTIALIFSMAALAQNDKTIEEKIEKYNEEMAEAMINGDNDKLMSLYDEDAISLPNNDKMIKGIDELRKANEEMDKTGWKVKSYEPTIMSVESHGNMIHEIGTYTMDVENKGTGDKRHVEGKYLTIWEKKNDGSMKIKTEIWNHDSNYNLSALSESKDPSGRDFDRSDVIDDSKGVNSDKLKKEVDEENPEGHHMTDEKK